MYSGLKFSFVLWTAVVLGGCATPGRNTGESPAFQGKPAYPVDWNQLPQGMYSRYIVITTPSEAGVLREGGIPLGQSPLTVDLDSPRAFRLTFLKTGYVVTSRFINPQPGVTVLKVELQKDPNNL